MGSNWVRLVVFSNDSHDYSGNLQFLSGHDGAVSAVSRLKIWFSLVELKLAHGKIVIDDSEHDIPRYGSPSPFDDQLIPVDNPKISHARSAHRMQCGNCRMLHDVIRQSQLPYPGLVTMPSLRYKTNILVHIVVINICTKYICKNTGSK